ncbi:energy transducer TonB [Pyxidicoccus parkwayensis]|uniref:Energy transducer TonB n=1 Tax=Pyxidicoccus parkwayensis TaxID=2813578 RepID=A0ABX7PB57_9BACT|nr:energy transducer TonB [Pyxidicoccus parkwaysis]QSQ27643.1 energy transducer TonB [Pyxidicoccus parkwaysis]
MFKSVTERQRAGRLGAGVWMSIGVHAALFAVVLFISARPPEAPPEPEIACPIFRVPSGPSVREVSLELAPQPRASAPQAQPRQRNRVPRTPRPLPTEPLPPEPTPAPSPGGNEERVLTGRIVGNLDDAPESPLPTGPLPTGLPPGLVGQAPVEEHIPFVGGMTPPVLLRGAPIEYTPQALQAGVEGTLVARCVITREGEMRDCRILKGMAHMDEAVLQALNTRHYSPVTFQGSPVSVTYNVTVRLKLPR